MDAAPFALELTLQDGLDHGGSREDIAQGMSMHRLSGHLILGLATFFSGMFVDSLPTRREAVSEVDVEIVGA
ncbi:hypothetical protein M3149_06855 [Hydrogenophaga intermedia]|nr:hypothetical protein [Hydrogenophaga intermedia]